MAATWKSLVTFCFFSMIAFAAETEPFAGTWRYRADRSQHTRTFRIYAVGEDEFQVNTAAGRGAVLPVDGSPRESPIGGIVALKKIDEHKYVYTLKRQTLYKRTITIDGDKMKWSIDQELDTGKHEFSESDWQRVGHGTGLAGEWNLTGEKDPAGDQETETIRAIPGGLRFGSSDQKREEDMYFDEKEHASQDPDEAKGISYVAKRLNPHAYRLISKKGGAVLFTSNCELSDDENTLTCTNIDHDGKKSVYVEERMSR